MSDDPLEFAVHLARQAGQFLKEQYASGAWEARLKNDRSVVTSADEAADRMIIDALQADFPNDQILTEETSHELLSVSPQGAGYVWIIDPLDGTTNFSLGLPFWGILIARLADGAPDTAVAYFPVLEEFYTARRGAGAWFNHQALQISTANSRSPLSFFACCSRTHRNYHVSVPYKTRILGSAGYSLCSIARGIAILGFESTCHIWDLAAPWLIVGEAGGTIFAVDSAQPFPISNKLDYTDVKYAVLAAANAEIAERGRSQIVRKT